MDWLALLLKLAHVLLAIAMVAGLVGRWILLTRGAGGGHLGLEDSAPRNEDRRDGRASLRSKASQSIGQGASSIGMRTPRSRATSSARS